MLLVSVPDLQERHRVALMSLSTHEGLCVLDLPLLSLQLSELVLEQARLLFKVPLQHGKCLLKELIKAFLDIVGVRFQPSHLLNQLTHLSLQ